MKILCLDTSAGSRVAWVDSDIARHAESDSARGHVEHLTALVREVLELPAGQSVAGRVDAVVVGTGPAAYTGLRAGIITARALALAAGVPCYGIPSLEVVARTAFDAEPQLPQVLALLDARRKELFGGVYQPDGAADVRIHTAPFVQTPTQIAQDYPQLLEFAAGPGAQIYPDLIAPPSMARTRIDVAVMAKMLRARLEKVKSAGHQEPELLPVQPIYLRRPDVSVPNQAKRTLK